MLLLLSCVYEITSGINHVAAKVCAKKHQVEKTYCTIEKLVAAIQTSAYFFPNCLYFIHYILTSVFFDKDKWPRPQKPYWGSMRPKQGKGCLLWQRFD